MAKWIAKATSKNKGKFSKKAKRAGKTTKQYIGIVLKPGSHASAKTKKEAALAKTLGRLSKKRRK